MIKAMTIKLKRKAKRGFLHSQIKCQMSAGSITGMMPLPRSKGPIVTQVYVRMIDASLKSISIFLVKFCLLKAILSNYNKIKGRSTSREGKYKSGGAFSPLIERLGNGKWESILNNTPST